MDLHGNSEGPQKVAVEDDYRDDDPISVNVRESQEAFRRDLPRLLKDSPEKWVAYAGSSQISIAESEIQLIRECLARGYAQGAFLTFSIEPEVPMIVELFPDR